MILRHLLAIAVLPFMVTVMVPFWLAERYGALPAIGGSRAAVLLQVLGLGLFCSGALLAAASVNRFANEGRGTLAPWDPPRVFVVHGPYRYVRNPMISGVILVLFGEALLLQSPAHGAWAVAFLCLNLAYIPLVEEPELRGRFGASYLAYCRNVRRFLPRRHPWSPSDC